MMIWAFGGRCSRLIVNEHIEILRDGVRLVGPRVASAETTAEVVDSELTKRGKRATASAKRSA